MPARTAGRNSVNHTGEYDVAVVGGGLTGAAIAWGLTRLGQRVAVLDEGDVAHRPSRGNFALVWVQGKGLGMSAYAGWTIRSSEAWTGFAALLREESSIDVAFTRPGGFVLALSDREIQARADALQRLHNQPGMVAYPYEVLDHTQISRILPHIGPEVAAATYCPLDGHCNSLKLLRALHIAMQRRGCVYLPNCAVVSVARLGEEFRLNTAGGVICGGKLMLAAGHDNARLAPMVGLGAPVRPQRGSIIVTERAAPFLRHPLSTIRQTDEGSVLIGDSQEEAGFDATVNLGVASAMADRAVRTFPLLGGLNVLRCWAALRVMTPDGFPIYDQSDTFPGAFVACCHSGVTLAAAHALVLAPHIAEGRLPPDELGAFTGRRLNVPSINQRHG